MAVTTSIHSIVQSSLMTMGLPIHWYIDGLHFALKCVQEMGYRDLPQIKSVRLTVAADHTITLPTDYVDWVRVGYDRGQYVAPLGEDRRYNRLAPATGTSYGDIYGDVGGLPYSWAYLPGFLTDYSEFNGRFFAETPNPRNSFLEIRERNLMQLDVSYDAGSTITLDYIYFNSAASTSLVHPYAAPAIEAYVVWKLSAHRRGMIQTNRFESQRLQDDYYRSLKQWRSQVVGLSLQGLERAIRSGHFSTPKI